MTSVYSKRELVFIISCCRCHSKINETWVRVLVSKVTPLTFNIHLSQRWAKHFGRETERRVLHGISLVGCAHMGWTHAELICQAAWTGSPVVCDCYRSWYMHKECVWSTWMAIVLIVNWYHRRSTMEMANLSAKLHVVWLYKTVVEVLEHQRLSRVPCSLWGTLSGMMICQHMDTSEC